MTISLQMEIAYIGNYDTYKGSTQHDTKHNGTSSLGNYDTYKGSTPVRIHGSYFAEMQGNYDTYKGSTLDKGD